MSYPLVEIEEEEGRKVWAYRAEVLGAILYVHKSLVDAGITTVEAEIESLCKRRLCP